MRRGLWARTEPRPCGGWSWARMEPRPCGGWSWAVRHLAGGARSPRGRCAVTAWAVRGHRVGGARSPRGRCAVTSRAVRGHRVGGAWSPRGRCVVTSRAVRGHRVGGTWSPRGWYVVTSRALLRLRVAGMLRPTDGTARVSKRVGPRRGRPADWLRGSRLVVELRAGWLRAEGLAVRGDGRPRRSDRAKA